MKKGDDAMLCFVTTCLPPQKSGIEMAILKRIKLFQQHHTSFKLITTDFDETLHIKLNHYHIKDSSVINMYNFFCKDTNTTPRKFGIDELAQQLTNITFVQTDVDNIYYGYLDNYKYLIVTTDPITQQISSVDVLDQGENIIKKEIFDCRGWRNKEQIFNNNLLAVEHIFSSQGKRIISIFWKPVHQLDQDSSLQNKPQLFELFWHNQKHYFNYESELITYFLDEVIYLVNERLNKSYYALIVDRTKELAEPVLNMKAPVVKYAYLHSDHIINHDDEIHSPLNYNYAYALNNVSAWQGVIMATKQQEAVFKKRYGNLVNTFVIPVSFANQATQHITYANRQNEIIEVARLSEEKRQGDLIKAFKIVHEQMPNVKLSFYGTGTNDYVNELKNMILDLRLKDAISFKGYTEQLDSVYNSASISVLPSDTEGFSLAVLESLEHGLPVVAYNNPYGVPELIKDNYNGFLVKPNDINMLASRMIELLRNKKLAEQMSMNAYQSIIPFTKQNVWHQWMTLINDSYNANQFLRNYYYQKPVSVPKELLG